MDWKIIADSCCDMTPQLRERLDVISVPLTMMLGKKEFIDDETLDLPGFMAEMKTCLEKIGSAAPSPHLYQEAMEKAVHSFVVTLSSQLSASYANAVLGKKLAEESNGIDTYVFDSKSATAGEVLIAIKIRELISSGANREQIIQSVNRFIDNMKTYFVLEKYDNLLKNGRLNKLTGKIINILNIKLLMGSDKDGGIALYGKPRGRIRMIEKLVSLIHESGKKTEGENIVITHCNNPELADQLCEAIKKQFRFKEIFIVPSGGLSTVYTDDKGIVMAF